MYLPQQSLRLLLISQIIIMVHKVNYAMPQVTLCLICRYRELDLRQKQLHVGASRQLKEVENTIKYTDTIQMHRYSHKV